MENQFFANLLVITLLFISSIRFIFIKKVKSDCLSIVPLITIIISLLINFTFGLSYINLIVFLISIFIFIWNFRALLRFINNLVIDHYGIWFRFISIINVLICIFGFVLLFNHKPSSSDEKKYNVKETIVKYSGNFEEGFDVLSNPLSKISFMLHKYEPKLKTVPNFSNTKIAIFIPPKVATVETYKSTIYNLVYDGYVVYTGEFYTNDNQFVSKFNNTKFFRKFFFQKKKKSNQHDYEILLKNLYPILKKEYESLIQFAEFEENDFVCLLGEEDVNFVMNEIKKENKNIDFVYDFSNCSEMYKTSGWGPIENTEPLLARILKYNPDSSGYISNHIANKFKEEAKFVNYSLSSGK